MCPICRTNAPLVYRGIRAYCAACGGPRTVLSGASLTHAGKPSAIGGTVVRAFGWATLAVGLFFAAVLGLIATIFSGTAGAIIGFGLAGFALVVFLVLRSGGKQLEQSGKDARDARRKQALFALAQNRGGRVQARDAAGALEMSIEAADEYLTTMAKQQPDVVGVDIGDQGEVYYLFRAIAEGGAGPWASAQPRVRIEHPAGVWEPSPPRPAPDPRVIEAEFEAAEEAQPPKRQHR